ncbi:MAG: 4Fe-4S binding protein [Nitrososphaeria archaeon]|nr:4Fe-4S binding protein [Nitrososphaeria archaeon]MDW7986143.1 4Fe-4S binding protein [Nitrososphaerota archaeon]
MVSARTINRIFSPILSGLNHIFFRPVTIKYPFEKSYNIPDSNYRFDPKEGIAYPGYRGRHILYLDKCTGCGACDRACENISEAISMVHGYDLSLKLSEDAYNNLKHEGEVAKAFKLLLEPFSGESKSIEKREDIYTIRLNTDPLFEYRYEVLYENLLENPFHRLIKNGWSIDLVEHKPVESARFKISKESYVIELSIEKRDFGIKQNKRSIFPAIDYGRCLPPWTPVFTLDGIKPIQEVKVGDLVLTHTGRFKKVTHVFERSYTGLLYTFKTLGNVEPLTVTEEHPILTYIMGTMRWVLPRQISYRTYLVRSIPLETLQLERLMFYHEQYHLTGRGGCTTLLYNELTPSPDLMRLIGYYIVEGTADSYGVSFDIGEEKRDLVEEIIVASKNIFREKISIKLNHSSEGLKLVIDSVEVMDFFKQFGTRSDQKHLPNWALLMPVDLQRELIRAIYLGDGYYSNNHRSYMYSDYFVIRTTSRILANQLPYILARLGVVASISLQKHSSGENCYTIKIHKPFIEKMASIVGVKVKNGGSNSQYNIKMVDDRIIISPVIDINVNYVHNFKVYNLEVEEDQSFIASNQIVHNCVFCGFCVDACPFYALEMGPSYELSSLEREELFYTPLMLANKFFETYPPETTWSEKTVMLIRRFK